ncbi:hypothetical protein DKP76_06995 [Falsochrobactrum shanghaiense]|uniref:Uncharacterized protein n=2 Tax=Falsochrobactrum shanghaiense TaxID=2201899 RepID=A0A316JAT8_9HYPH|nr:hypothetical protein DKP76_06995 [Falsochrobactrum shanghaiense]
MFPDVNHIHDCAQPSAPVHGMSLRDYFAGQALAGWPVTDHGPDLASKCYALADAMLAARGH